jgi:hypothetical protein
MSSFVGAIAIADLVKTTLGPKGMDKILQSVFIFNFYVFYCFIDMTINLQKQLKFLTFFFIGLSLL